MQTQEAALVSLVPVIGRIRDMAHLAADWDGDDADAPTAPAVATACCLIKAVVEAQERRGRGRTVPSASAPLPDGGIGVEWSGRRGRVDVQANPDGTCGYLVKWGTGRDAGWEEADRASLDAVLAPVDRVLAI
jgi:hypothetical protein